MTTTIVAPVVRAGRALVAVAKIFGSDVRRCFSFVVGSRGSRSGQAATCHFAQANAVRDGLESHQNVSARRRPLARARAPSAAQKNAHRRPLTPRLSRALSRPLRSVKTPGGRLLVQYLRKKGTNVKCGDCGCSNIHGVSAPAAPRRVAPTCQRSEFCVLSVVVVGSFVRSCRSQIPAKRPYEMSRLSKRRKTVNRAYGGSRCAECVRNRILRAFLIEEHKAFTIAAKLKAKSGPKKAKVAKKPVKKNVDKKAAEKTKEIKAVIKAKVCNFLFCVCVRVCVCVCVCASTVRDNILQSTTIIGIQDAAAPKAGSSAAKKAAPAKRGSFQLVCDVVCVFSISTN